MEVNIKAADPGTDVEEKLLQANQGLYGLNAFSKSLAANSNVEDLSRSIVDEISGKLGFPFCVLGLLDDSGVNIHIKAFSGKYLEKTINSTFISSGMSFNSYLAEREVISSESIGEGDELNSWFISRINKNLTESQRIKEILYVPISVKSRNLGVLAVGFSSPIESRDVSLIYSISNNIAMAIDNAILYERCRKYFVQSVNALIAAIEAKDRYTKGHSQRVSNYTVHIAEKLSLSKEQIEEIKMAGILRDIGKIGVNDSILMKPGKLTKDEYEEVKRHPIIANRILHHIGFPQNALKAIAYHHERYDGKGYPFGISGDRITLEAQIIAVADAFDAMTSNRPYREAMSVDEALKELVANKSRQFNPVVVDAMIKLKDSLKSERIEEKVPQRI
ncbi:MAG: HD-GYP domain-containing protein [Clostridiales bacterium]|jgi:HD-GYP domain-containing protein (c-di-GMP phosphodiesterase class II)|nr:HD-GYP domain-containing protein [Eubacteriales bacterium]MDH7567699.1 HD-GYP domain-containing protein [Clostridiales bacterium]